PHLPLLLWWAVEDKAVAGRESILWLFDDPATWDLPLVRQVLVERLARRYLAEGTDDGLRACAALLDRAPSAAALDQLVSGMEQALEGRRLPRVPTILER